MKKRLLAFIVVITVICSSFGFSATADDAMENVTAEEIYATEEFDICVALGIFTDSVKPADAVTRGALAQSSARLLNLQDIVPTGSDFDDVSQSSPYYNAIGMVSKSDIMLGDGTGNFRPNDNAKLADVATVLVRTIGYDVVAQSKGGYPSGYLGQAGVLGILEDVSAQDELNFNEFAKIIVNTFEVEILSLESLPGNGTYKLTDSTVLDLMNITKIEGIVKKNDITALYSANQPCNQGYVLIDDTLVLYGDTRLKDMLGCSVIVYAEDTTKDYERIAYYATVAKMGDMLIDFDDVDTSYNFFQKNEVKYYDADGRLKTKKIESGFAVIYNGVASNFRTMDLVVNKEGTLRFIDNDSNSSADVVIIEAYQDYVVDAFSLEQKVLTDKFGKNFDFNNLDEEDIMVVDKNGTPQSLTNLKEWDALSVYDSYVDKKTNSGDRFVKIIISTDTIDGTLDSISKNNGNMKITIDGSEYDVSAFYISNAGIPSLTLGMKGTFYLNAADQVIAYDMNAVEKLYLKYGVLVDADRGEGFDTSVAYKIYTQKGEWITPFAAKNVKIDGETKKDDERYNCLLESGTIKRQIIIYKLDDEGNITYIDTQNLGSKESDDTLHLLHSINDSGLRYRKGPNTFSRKVNLTQNTVTFSIPSDPNADDDEYSINILYDEANPKSIEAYYDTTPFEASCVFMYDASASTIKLSQSCLVGRISRVIENDEEVYKLTTYDSSGEKVVFAEIDADGIKKVSEGDVIAYSKNGVGNIDNVQMVYDLSEKEKKVEDSKFLSDERVFFGWIYKRYKNMFSLSFNEITGDTASESLETFNMGQYKTFVYDISEDTVKAASQADLLDYDNFGDDCGFVVGTDYCDWPRALFIYVK